MPTHETPPEQPRPAPRAAPWRRIVVLGHSGFVGRHLMTGLRAAYPEAELVGRSSGDVDLTRAEAAHEVAALGGPGTALIVCSGIKKQHGDTPETFGRNVAMALTLGAALREAPVGRVIFLGTADVYGEEVHNTAITEETPLRPASYYGMAKAASEWLLDRARREGGAASLSLLRMPFIYGPGDQGGIYGPLGFLRAARAGQPIVLWGDGSELREFLFVEDLAAVVCRLLPLEHTGVLNVATGRSHSFREVVEIVQRLLPGGAQVQNRPRTKGKVDNAFDTRRLGEALPGLRFTPLAHGIARTWAAVLAEGRT